MLLDLLGLPIGISVQVGTTTARSVMVAVVVDLLGLLFLFFVLRLCRCRVVERLRLRIPGKENGCALIVLQNEAGKRH